jgi:hypothetical protein
MYHFRLERTDGSSADLPVRDAHVAPGRRDPARR